MVKVNISDEPANFDTECRQPGKDWLAKNPNAKRPKDFWTPFKANLCDAFLERCGYHAMVEMIGTVDHFVSVNEDIDKAYEWKNYRFACDFMNRSKQAVPSQKVLDPFEVEDDWFEIILPSLQMKLTDKVSEALRSKAQFTIERLHLIDDERILKLRSKWYKMYADGKIDLETLRKVAPQIAAAVESGSAKC